MKNLILILVASLFATGMFAQGKSCKGKKNPEMRAELKAHKEKNVTPVLQKYHDKMDASFNKSDYTQIQAIRVKASQLKEEQKAIKKEMKAEMQNADDRSSIKDQFQTQIEAQRAKKRAIHEELKPILERNEEMLKGIAEALKPYKETWKTETRAIMSKYMTDEELEQCKSGRGKKGGYGKRGEHRKNNGNRPEHGTKPSKGKRDMDRSERPQTNGQHADRGNKGEHRMKRKMTAFVLWDGKSRNTEVEDTGYNLEGNQKPMMSKNFPNPAVNETTVTFELPKDSETVNVSITDLQGKVLRRYNYRNLTAGQQSIDLNLRGLSSGNYFYTVIGNGIKETKKLIIAK